MLFNSSDWAGEDLHKVVQIVDPSVVVEQSVEKLTVKSHKGCGPMSTDVGVNKQFIGAIDNSHLNKLFNNKNDITLTRYSIHSLRPANPILFAPAFFRKLSIRNLISQERYASKVVWGLPRRRPC